MSPEQVIFNTIDTSVPSNIDNVAKIEMNYRFSVAIDMPQCDSTFRNNLLLKLAVEMKL